jgi:peptidoglycan/xylan/chitin deacetylase (PgdA/CDA1 family)
MYHSVDGSGSVVSVSAAQFERHMEGLARSGFRTLSLGDAARSLSSGGSLPERAVVITFDDGYRNVYTHAFPVLARHGFTATVFLVSDFVDRPGLHAPPELHAPRLPFLTSSEIHEMLRHGIEMGAHTVSHADLSAVPLDDAVREVVDSKQRLEDLVGRAITTFAYPFGRYTPDVRDAVSRSFDCAVSTRLGFARPASDPFALERLDAYYLRSLPMASVLSSSGGRLYLQGRNVLRRVKGLLARRR